MEIDLGTRGYSLSLSRIMAKSRNSLGHHSSHNLNIHLTMFISFSFYNMKYEQKSREDNTTRDSFQHKEVVE